MLFIYRKRGQAVYLQAPGLERDIKVVVLAVNPNGDVKLGFDAPDDVDIEREENLEGDNEAE